MRADPVVLALTGMPAPEHTKDATFVRLDAAGLNGGVPSALAASEYTTPQSRLFARSHGNIPEIDATTWRVVVDGLVDHPLELSLADLQERFPVRDVTATLICAGLRRHEFLQLGPLPGELPWRGEPAGNVRWGGVSLSDVLAAARVAAECRHVVATGLDRVERHGEQVGFGGSIPIEKARQQDVLLAWNLDGNPLPREHGFPVRLVVPGWIGARSVKWLGRIELSRDPSTNYFRTRAYRIQRTVNRADPFDVSAGDPLEEIALNSLIALPEHGADLRAGAVDLSGWAIGPDAQAPNRVEVSADGGTTWFVAALQPAVDRWSWRLWNATLRLAPGSYELVVRAWDHVGRAQPRTISETWNVKGYANNAWHRVSVRVNA